MLHTINRKFYFIAFVLFLLIGLGYGILVVFLNEQHVSALRTHEVALTERRVNLLKSLFHELRLWEGEVLSRKSPEADRKFGLTIEKFRTTVGQLKGRDVRDEFDAKLRKISADLNHYESAYNTIQQLKTEQRLIFTRIDTNYKSIASNVLPSQNILLVKPLFTLTQFLMSYRLDRRESEFRALVLIMDYLDLNFRNAGILDDRMKGYINSFRDLLTKDYEIEREIKSVGLQFENTSRRLMRMLSEIAGESELWLKKSYDENNKRRERFIWVYFLTICIGMVMLLLLLAMIARTILKPFKDMARVMREVEANNISARFPTDGRKKDEIVELGISFNHMLDAIESKSEKLLDYQKELEAKVSQLAVSETELKKHRENLELLVKERTRELTIANSELQQEIVERKKSEQERLRLEGQLIQAHKMESIGTLAGGIAHDFNNLLMGIQGRASMMLLDLQRSDPKFEHLKAIEEHTISAADLTKQLLGFARGGKYEVKTIDVNELVRNSAAMFGRTRKEIRIHTRLERPLASVEADPRQIEQVLLNMYVNAWQAMPEGGELSLSTTTVTLEEAEAAAHSLAAGRYVRIMVADTGIGMDAETGRRIFDPFFTTKEKTRGTGLGLASAYGIIQNHSGNIKVDSEVGRGTTFYIYLPASEKAVQPVVAPEEKIVAGSETILLVDDEEMLIDVGRAMLEKLGYRVEVARSGQQALEAIDRMGSRIDLVILDMIMPGIDGGQTYDRIRDLRPRLPVILSSGYSINGQAMKIMRRGCNGFIQKPFNIAELSRKVRAVLRDRGGRHQN